jgi:hypothetical protein
MDNTNTSDNRNAIKKPAHRPSIYTKELAANICERIADGESLRKICSDDDMPCRKTVHIWLLDPDKEEFLHQYKEACDIRTENMFDALIEIADIGSGEVQRDRLRIEIRKWYLSKIMPKKYGDKMDITSGNKPIPLLQNVSNSNSNQKDSEPKQEN